MTPVSKSRGSYKEDPVTYFNSEKREERKGNKMKFMICSREGMGNRNSCVCQVVDGEESGGKRSFTFRMIDGFFARRKSCGKRRKLVGGSAGEVELVKGECFNKKNLQSLPDKMCSSTFGYFEEKVKSKGARNRIRIRLGARVLRNSISIQTEI